MPASSLEIALASHIPLVSIGTVPSVSIALDAKPPLHTLDNQVNSIAAVGGIPNTYLRTHMKILLDNLVKNILL